MQTFPTVRQEGFSPEPLDHALSSLRKISDLVYD
jgi:hypothetical protein